jgi:hypothetical protein
MTESAADLPGWLPPLVRLQASKTYAAVRASGRDRELETVRRITADVRMKRVWQQLQKRRRSGSAQYMHPVFDPAADETDYLPSRAARFQTRSEWMQQIGLAAIYKVMVNQCLLLLPSQTASGSVFYKQAETLRELMAQLNDYTIEPTRRKKAFKAKREKLLAFLAKTLCVVEDLGKDYRESIASDVPEAVAMSIALRMDMLFGKPTSGASYMYGVTATIIGVLLGSAGIDRQVTAANVRNIVHSGPWKITYRFTL